MIDVAAPAKGRKKLLLKLFNHMPQLIFFLL